MQEEKQEVHPSFGIISASRCQTNNGWFFGSEIKNQNFINIEVKYCEKVEGDILDSYLPRQGIVRISLTPIQWASFLTNMNTMGVPCTIAWTEKDGSIEYIPPKSSRLKTLQEDFEFSYSKDLVDKPIDALITEINSLKISKKKKDELTKSLQFIRNRARSRADFYLKRTKEKAGRIINEGKAAIEAFTEFTIRKLGLEKLEDLKKLLNRKND